jgi:hypothetical protein
MALLSTTNQYSIKGRSPLDAKALVKTYADLLNPATWTVEGVISAYNGMITAVWLNSADTKQNGVYFLHDPAITSTRGNPPDVTNPNNWHKLGGLDNLPGLTEQLELIQKDLKEVRSDVDELQDSATEVVNLKSELPRPGFPGKLYVVTNEAMTYVWYNDDYLPVGDNTEIQIISGGGPTA